jgi:hypothetical protein
MQIKATQKFCSPFRMVKNQDKKPNNKTTNIGMGPREKLVLYFSGNVN